MEWLKAFAILIGRILLVLIFLNSGIGKIGNFEGTAQYMAKFGMPYTNFFLLGAIFFELVGSITVILGYFTRFGALLLLIFLIPTTLIFHTNFADPNADDSLYEECEHVWGMSHPSRCRTGTIQFGLSFKGQKEIK